MMCSPALTCAHVLAPSTTSAHGFPTVARMAPQSPARVSTAVRLPAELHAELQRQAEERDVSVNFLVTRAVAHYLRALGPADPLANSIAWKER